MPAMKAAKSPAHRPTAVAGALPSLHRDSALCRFVSGTLAVYYIANYTLTIIAEYWIMLSLYYRHIKTPGKGLSDQLRGHSEFPRSTVLLPSREVLP